MAEAQLVLDRNLTRLLDDVSAAHGVEREVPLRVAYGLLVGRNAGEAEEDTTFAALLGREVPAGPEMTWEQQASGELLGVLHHADGHLAEHYLTLLEAALTTPGARVRSLAHTTAAERDLLAGWGTDDTSGRPENLVAAFRAQALSTPDAVALTFHDGTFTYAELRARSERLARALVERGITPESVVGLAADRSAALVVAMLAVATAGAAYLPLDPAYPDARLAFMVADSRAVLVLAYTEPGWAEVPVLPLDLTADTLATLPVVHGDQRACVLYTSGSTGRPKGVETTHRGIVRLVCDAAYFDVGPDDVVAHAASVSFDAASLEVWGALLNGARLTGVRKDEVLAPDLLARRIRDDRVTAMFLTTSVFHLCADTAPAMFAPLRVLFFGGEAADGRRVASVRAAAPGTRLVNGYGPTECTTFASTFDGVDAAAVVPLGRPIAATSLRVLDRYGRVTGVGVPGELHIGGAGLARGYTGRPDLTAERFVAGPSGERLYRTGDVVRWRPDGVLEYLGRADDQVKIRGVRIEPDEIASVLGTCPEVRAAVVGVRGDGLVAHVVPAGRVDPRELRAFLAERLPEAMVPAWYVTVPAIPLTPNGKADRRALPEPTHAHSAHATSHVPPSGAAEQAIAEIWAELLDVPVVSAHDDFLALGGHSLLATRVVSRVEARLGTRLSVADVFEARTVAALAARAGRTPGAPITAAGDGPHLLSFAQRRLWFLDRLAPGNPHYNVPLVLSIDGPLDVPALRRSVHALVRRHSALRTSVVVVDGEPHQVIATDIALPMDVEEVPDPDAAARAEALRPFDLGAGPLVRVRLLRLGPFRHRLLLTTHHAVSDGWSVGVLVGDIGVLYAAEVSGVEAELPPLPTEYADYASWQRKVLHDGAQLAYWTARLAGAPVLDLPTDRPRPAVSRHAGDSVPLHLSADLARRLAETGRAQGVTPFMILMAAFQLVMGRYGGVRDVSVGTPVSGRTRPEVEGLVGFFVNTVVVRSRWDDEPAFAEFLQRVRAEVLGAHEHQDVPFDQVVEALRPPRDTSRTPLFGVMLAMQNVLAGTSALPGLSVEVREAPTEVAKFDLTVVWEESSFDGGELRGYAEYDVDLFDRETVARMMTHYLTLLESALTTPTMRVSHLAMVTEQNEEPCAPATSKDLCALFGAAATRWADRTAIVHNGRFLSYAELDTRSRRVSAYLRAHGMRPGDAVVVRMERSLDWPVALLGILRTGASYVPVDVGVPRERFEHVLRDSGARLVLTDIEEALGYPDDVRPADVPPEAVAYVLYTSGTTGLPKGVCVSHGNLAHTLEAVADRYGLVQDDRVLQFASLTFDVAAEELFATLLRGATVVLLPPGPVPGIGELTALARSERLTVLNLPASYWHEWVAVLAAHPPAACPDLRLVVVGSERVDGGRLTRWRAATNVRWLNAYGPTEATITATVHEPVEATGGTVPIGLPLPGVRAYVLDPALRPVPRGVPGDLYLAGPGVAHGYLGDPARTAGSFVPDPRGATGDRMYATRDRARRAAGGVLEFLGREDDQVKLRGFRIELGEVEAALASCPGVHEAAVVLREEALVGYLTGDAGEADLRAHLADRLPAYMVPGAFVRLDRLPRGERGKVDRQALPAPERALGNTGVPSGELESAVAAIWCEVLARDEVGAQDNFFELGGHSLLVVRVQARLSELLDRTVPVVDLFRFPTVRALARHLADDTTAAGGGGRSRAEARKVVRARRRAV
ncbi:amino acid adenylation domain-containing protein [Lentzea sp. NPDC058436]|uniref:amino acid adenylation domain-containing protein n=1 Tax=Lentzea sp. NPDC058436 TaxID=3346499 RepID=UPI00364DED96